MKIALLRSKPRNVVILILVLLASLHFVLYFSQNYSINLAAPDENTAPTTSWLAEHVTKLPNNNNNNNYNNDNNDSNNNNNEAFIRDISSRLAGEVRRKDQGDKDKFPNNEKEIGNWSNYKVPAPPARDSENEVFQQGPASQAEKDGFVRPPQDTVDEVFGDDIIVNEFNEFVQKPNLRKGFNALDGRVELLPKSSGIRKYTNFGTSDRHTCDAQYCDINGRRVKKEILKETPDDMFTFLPPPEKFMKEFRNPCWKGDDLEGEEKLFCMPYFYIIGFTKCGTTDLFAILKNHTLVSSRAGKETHYFDRLRRGRIIRMNRKPTRLPVSFMSWTNAGKFRQNLISTYKKLEDSDVLFHGVTMDATPAHVWDNEYWEIFHPGYREPPVTNADVIATINPGAKIIVSLRNPISRMQSAYQFFCAFHVYPCDRPVTPLKFHKLVKEAVDSFKMCLKTNTPRGCVYKTKNHQLATHLYASMYSVYLTDWLAVFPRKQVHVIMFEEHISDEIHSINSVCDFLDIPRFPVQYMEKYLEEHNVRNSLPDSKRIPYILPETKQLLKDFFKPYLDDLVRTLGDDKWYWGLY